MKKLLSIVVVLLLVVSFAVIGCKKEEPAPAVDAPAVEEPADAPAEEAAGE